MADENWAKLVDEQEGGGLSRQITKLSLNGEKEKAAEDGDCKKSSPPIIIPPADPKISFGGGGDTKEDDEKSPTLAEASYLRKILGNKLLNSKNDVEILRKDPNSPLYAVKSFEELNLWPELLKGVYALGFNYPSKIQETALPTLLADPPQNMIAQSQSGTGKTAAFVLAMLSRVNPQNHWPQVLCLSPTYELTLQTGHVVKQMGQYCREVTVCLAVRGEEIKKNQKIQDHIIIGTPGKVLDWATKFNAFDAKKINVFVLDEADVMIDTQGHRDQSIRIHKLLRRDCQMLLFSATYDQEIIEFAEAIVHDPVTIRLRREEESLDNIKQFYIECKNAEEKFQALVNIYGGITIGQAMIFCQTRKTASWLSEKMTKDGHAVGLLSGELTVEQRVDILNRFRQGKEKVLITTNVSARGIDVEQVTVVVNFDIPMDMKRKADCETYLHRIGRTGRFGKAGLAINMVDGQHSKNLLKQIEDHFGRKIVKLDAEDIDELEKIAA